MLQAHFTPSLVRLLLSPEEAIYLFIYNDDNTVMYEKNKKRNLSVINVARVLSSRFSKTCLCLALFENVVYPCTLCEDVVFVVVVQLLILCHSAHAKCR